MLEKIDFNLMLRLAETPCRRQFYYNSIYLNRRKEIIHLLTGQQGLASYYRTAVEHAEENMKIDNSWLRGGK